MSLERNKNAFVSDNFYVPRASQYNNTRAKSRQ